MGTHKFHDANRAISGYLFKDEDSNVREREERQRELARLALEAQNKLSAEEQLKKDRQEQLDRLIKEAQDAKAEVAQLQQELRDANSSKRDLERQLETAKNETKFAKDASTRLDTEHKSIENDLQSKLANAVNLHATAKNEVL
ncbi:hypothetical protein TWF696_000276 [Orbilia brochopaga]|uniref:Myosin heavy chain n=1 Tax=Orbilia brochopaga TaxID=3140254 RepID=A0AAV9VB77_9PEZI